MGIASLHPSYGSTQKALSTDRHVGREALSRVHYR
jgi:hypothetical protein